MLYKDDEDELGMCMIGINICIYVGYSKRSEAKKLLHVNLPHTKSICMYLVSFYTSYFIRQYIFIRHCSEPLSGDGKFRLKIERGDIKL